MPVHFRFNHNETHEDAKLGLIDDEMCAEAGIRSDARMWSVHFMRARDFGASMSNRTGHVTPEIFDAWMADEANAFWTEDLGPEDRAILRKFLCEKYTFHAYRG